MSYYVKFDFKTCTPEILQEITQTAQDEIGLGYRKNSKNVVFSIDEDTEHGRCFATMSKGTIWCDDDELAPIVAVLVKHGIKHETGGY